MLKVIKTELYRDDKGKLKFIYPIPLNDFRVEMVEEMLMGALIEKKCIITCGDNLMSIAVIIMSETT